MFHGKRPEISLELCWPMDQQMHEESTGPSGHCFYVAFCHSVLMMGTNTTEGDPLILECHVVQHVLSSKWMVISMEVLELDSIVRGELLELMLAPEGFANAK